MRRLFFFATVAALFAMLCNATVPAAAALHAAAAGDTLALGEICTTRGIAGDGEHQSMPMDCPLCDLQAHGVALPAMPWTMRHPAIGRSGYPPLFLSSPHPLAVWTSSQARAPPRNVF